MKKNTEKIYLLLTLLLLSSGSFAQHLVPEYIQNVDATKAAVWNQDIRGGYHQVDSIADRDSISIDRRVNGMVVAWNEPSEYAVKRFSGADTTNAEWWNNSNWFAISSNEFDNIVVSDTLFLGTDTITEIVETLPAGNDGNIQVNRGGVFSGSDSLNWSGGELFVEGNVNFKSKSSLGLENALLIENGNGDDLLTVVDDGETTLNGNLNVNQDNFSFNGTTIKSKLSNNLGNIIETQNGGALTLNGFNNGLGANLGTQDFNSYFVDYNFASTLNASGLSGHEYFTFDQINVNSQPFTRMGINCLNSTFNTLLRIELDKTGATQPAEVTVIDVVDLYGTHDVDLGGTTKIKAGLKIDLNDSFTTTTTGTGLVRSLWLNAEGGDENQAIYIDNGIIQHSGLNIDRQSITLADDATYTLPIGASGWGYIHFGDNDGWIEIGFESDGTIENKDSRNVVTTDTDTRYCVFNDSGTITIKNRSGVSTNVKFSINY